MKRSPKAQICAFALLTVLVVLTLMTPPVLCQTSSAQPTITLIPSEENTGLTTHILALNVETHVNHIKTVQGRIDGIIAQGGLAIVAHPRVSTLTPLHLASLNGYLGIEIYNAEVAQTSKLLADATATWDFINTDRTLKGEDLVWGFAVDDAHQANDFGRAYTMARSASPDPSPVVSGLTNGCFYATTGVRIADIEVVTSGNPDMIAVTLPQKGNITFIKMGGVVVRRVLSSRSATYAVKGNEGYIRVEVSSSAGKAWTQPIRVFNANSLDNPYASQGAWYKGSVHCHTTNSDGELTPQQVVDWHVQNGYNFLAITDHNVITVT